MAWNIELSPLAEKHLDQLDKPIAKRILKFLFERVAALENPRSIGEPLTGSRLGDYWKYRVGDYRLISTIEDEKLEILVIKIGNRREVYKKS